MFEDERVHRQDGQRLPALDFDLLVAERRGDLGRADLLGPHRANGLDDVNQVGGFAFCASEDSGRQLAVGVGLNGNVDREVVGDAATLDGERERQAPGWAVVPALTPGLYISTTLVTEL